MGSYQITKSHDECGNVIPAVRATVVIKACGALAVRDRRWLSILHGPSCLISVPMKDLLGVPSFPEVSGISDLGYEELGPLDHHLAALIESIAAPVSALDFACDRVSQRCLRNFAWEAGCFSNPVTK